MPGRGRKRLASSRTFGRPEAGQSRISERGTNPVHAEGVNDCRVLIDFVVHAVYFGGGREHGMGAGILRSRVFQGTACQWNIN